MVLANDAQGRDQFEPDPAGADDAKHGGRAEMVFPAIDRDIGELRQHLRQDSVGDQVCEGPKKCWRGAFALKPITVRQPCCRPQRALGVTWCRCGHFADWGWIDGRPCDVIRRPANSGSKTGLEISAGCSAGGR